MHAIWTFGSAQFNVPPPAGQSPGQVAVDSVAPHTESPQTSPPEEPASGPVVWPPLPQSCGQELASLAEQMPSPHTGGGFVVVFTAASVPVLGSPEVPKLHAASPNNRQAPSLILIIARIVQSSNSGSTRKRESGSSGGRLSTVRAVHGLCNAARNRSAKRAVLRADQIRILVEDSLRVAPRLEQQRGVLRQIAEAQPRHAGLAWTE